MRFKHLQTANSLGWENLVERVDQLASTVEGTAFLGLVCQCQHRLRRRQ